MHPNDPFTATRSGHPSFGRLAAGAVLALTATAGSLVLAVRLARHVASLVSSGLGVPGTLATARVEDLVAGVAVLVALALGTWLSVGLTAAAACVGVRSLGYRWRLGEDLVARTAPAAVRRAVALSAGTSVALASAALPASAQAAPPPGDLGWSPTVTAAPWPSAPDGAAQPDDVDAPPRDGTGPDGDDAGNATPGAAAAHAPTTSPALGTPVPPASGTTAQSEASAAPVVPGTPTAPAAGPAPQAVVDRASVPAPGAPAGPLPVQAADAAPSRAGADTPATAFGPPGAGPGRATSSAPSPMSATGGRTAETGPAREAPAAGRSPAGGGSPTMPFTAGPTGAPTVPLAARPPAAGTTGTTAPAPTSAGPASADTGTSGTVTVQPGDTLWGIAADFLAAGATVQDVATAWPQWYAANRDVIGPDPDVITPGQQLARPTTPGPDSPVPTDGAGS